MSKRQLSIAIFGNINNYPLLLAQGLKDLGHRVRLLINRKEILHRPEARYPDWSNAYPDWIVDCSGITEEDIAFETPAINKVVRYLTRKVDLVILNDVGPAFSGYLNVPYAVVLTGSDLTYYANYDSLNMRTSMWAPEFKRSPKGRHYLLRFSDFVSRQRDGILAADLVCYGQRGMIPSGDRLLDEIGVGDRQRLMLHFANTIDLKSQPAPKNERLTLLCGSRIVYRADQHPYLSATDFKGTDVLLKGFAQYIKAGGNGVLRLFRKAFDLEYAISLIAELNIESHIEWLDEMPLFRFYKEMAAADLICDQFGTSFPGMVTMDAYALGRPVIANLRNEIFEQCLPESLPGYDAITSEHICEHLV